MSNPSEGMQAEEGESKVILWAILILLNALLLFHVIFPAFAASEESGRTYLASFVVVISLIIFNRKFWFLLVWRQQNPG